jgi:hypothetical protein
MRKRKRYSGFIVREDIVGDKPLFHVLYAEETKSQQFGRRKDAERWRRKFLRI